MEVYIHTHFPKLTPEGNTRIDVQQVNIWKYCDMQSWLRLSAVTILTPAVYNIGTWWQGLTQTKTTAANIRRCVHKEGLMVCQRMLTLKPRTEWNHSTPPPLCHDQWQPHPAPFSTPDSWVIQPICPEIGLQNKSWLTLLNYSYTSNSQMHLLEEDKLTSGCKTLSPVIFILTDYYSTSQGKGK